MKRKSSNVDGKMFQSLLLNAPKKYIVSKYEIILLEKKGALLKWSKQNIYF